MGSSTLREPGNTASGLAGTGGAEYKPCIM